MLENERQIWYAAFKAKDTRFDGRLFVGVSSTGIYCRSVCRAKLPKAENCTFYATAAEAEQAGFRPCLICRPELAPGNAPVDATSALAHRTARLLEELCGSEQSMEEVAHRLGCTDRHLRRAFTAEYSVSPVQYLQTCRLLLAKNLLTDTDLSVIEVAMAAGFGSLRRFNDLFKKQYNLVPTALRQQAVAAKSKESNVTLTLGYRPPYQWQQMLDFLALRAIPGVETVRDGEYIRTVHFETSEQRHVYGWIRVGHQPQKNALTITVDIALLPVLTQVLARVRHLFDLYCDPEAVYETLESMNDIRPGLCVLGTRVPGSFDPFEMAVRAVLGQQITVKGARTLAARLVETYGVPIQTGIEGLTHVFPLPEGILALDGPISNHLGPLGITGARANTIFELARVLVQKDVDFNFCAQPETEMQKLMTVPGIGAWTAQYIAMRAMGWPDAFLHTDYGVKKALEPRTPKEILDLAEVWRPWRSYATINLWNYL
jgi:3-methyladenine DNA glycosylase/8-oxoguanine DNA glycosylase